MVGKPSIVDFLEAGLQATNLRQQAIANNVANLNTPDYRRSAVRFEDVLSEQMDSPSGVDLDEVEPEIYQPMETPVNGMGNDVDLETEIGELVKNTGRHKAYLKMLATQYSQYEQAMDL